MFPPSTRKSKRDRQKGVAALEMAIVLPLFIFVFFMILDVSLLLLSRQEMTRIAQSAARICVAQQPPPNNATSSVVKCAQQQLAMYMNSSGVKSFCSLQYPTILTKTAAASYGQPTQIYAVDIKMPCVYRFFTPGPSSMVVEGHAAMPFLGQQ